MAMTTNHVRQRISRWLTGPVTIRELLDVVAAVGEHPADVDAQIARLYDWHHARAVLALQLAVAPGAVAALAIVTRGPSVAVDLVGVAIVALSLGIGLR
jgi:hypothetical protein